MAYVQTDAFNQAIKRLTKNTYVEGTLKPKKGGVIEIKNKDISVGSLYITNQCVNDDSSLRFGAVYSAECGISIKTKIDRYLLFDAELSLSYFLKLDDGSYEECKLGKFFIGDAKRNGENVTLKGYDSMLLFDTTVLDEITGTPYEVLTFICEMFGIPLAHTKEEIEAFPNSKATLVISPTHVKTYREALSYIACLFCGFCYIDNNSALKIGTYKSTPIDTIEAKLRTSTSVSDFRSYFKGVAAQFEYQGAFETAMVIDDASDGFLCDMGTIPIILNAPKEYHEQLVQAMYEVIKNISHTPASITFTGNPSYELGDMVTIVQRDGTSVDTLITFYKWTYRGSEQLKGAGGNPKLPTSKEQTDKAIASLRSEIEAKSIAIYTSTNARKLTFSDKETQLVAMNIASLKDSKALFNAMFEFELSNDADVLFRYYFDSVAQPSDDVVVYCNKGKNVVTLFNNFEMAANSRTTLQIKATIKYVESDKRITDAKIISYENFIAATRGKMQDLSNALKSATGFPVNFDENIVFEEGVIDTTIPTCTFDKGSIKASFFGQGLAGTSAWDGTITFYEPFVTVTRNQRKVTVKTDKMHDVFSATTHIPIPVVSSDKYVEQYRVEQERHTAHFIGGPEFEFKKIPTADAVESFVPVKRAMRKVTVSGMKASISVGTEDATE